MTIGKLGRMLILGVLLVVSGCGNDCMTRAAAAAQVNILDSAGDPLPVDALTWFQGTEAGTASCQGGPGPCSRWILDRAPIGSFQVHATSGAKAGDASAEFAWTGGCPNTPVPVNLKITLM